MAPPHHPLAEVLDRADLGPWERAFVRLLDEVWQVEPEVLPSEAWVHFADGDIAWFRRFMALDPGDVEAELAALEAWQVLRAGPDARPATRNPRLLKELGHLLGARRGAGGED